MIGLLGRYLSDGREFHPENFYWIAESPAGPETEQGRVQGNMRAADPKILFDCREKIG